MLSLVMFQTDYVKHLIELGQADAKARHPQIRRFLGEESPDRKASARLEAKQARIARQIVHWFGARCRGEWMEPAD
jgi:hypothetical protein